MTKQFTIIFLLIAIVTNDFGWTSESNGLPLSADQWYELFGYHKSPHSRKTLEKILRAQHTDQANFDASKASSKKTSVNNQSLKPKKCDPRSLLAQALRASPEKMKAAFKLHVPNLPLNKLLHPDNKKISFLERCIKCQRDYSSTTALLVSKIRESGPENVQTALNIVNAITSKTNAELQELQKKEMNRNANLQNRLRYQHKTIRDLNQSLSSDVSSNSKGNLFNPGLPSALETAAGNIDFFEDDSEQQLQQEKR